MGDEPRFTLEHASDCARHNAPAFARGICSCGLYEQIAREAEAVSEGEMHEAPYTTQTKVLRLVTAIRQLWLDAANLSGGSDRARLIEALRPFAEMYGALMISDSSLQTAPSDYRVRQLSADITKSEVTLGHLRAAADLVKEMEERDGA